MTQRPPLVIKGLRTQRLVLRRVDPVTDANDLFLVDGDPAVHAFVYGARPSVSVQETRERLDAELAGNGGASWAIRTRAGGAALGTIGVFGDQGTTIRGLGWSLRPSHWGLGITGEAATAVVAYLLGQPGVDGLEAWIDSQNQASLGVARRAGLRECARLPRTYADRIGQTVVMAAAAEATDPSVFTINPALEVRDVDATSAVLRDVLSLNLAWAFGAPTRVAALAVAPWGGCPAVLLRARVEPARQADLTFEVGGSVDDVHKRAAAAGVELIDLPADQPWGRRDFTFALPEGHRLTVSGATAPPAVAGASGVEGV